jgi:hypothetical protein
MRKSKRKKLQRFLHEGLKGGNVKGATSWQTWCPVNNFPGR